MSAIYKRELKSYFHSMIGYVFIAFLIAFTGVYFMAYNMNYGYPYFSYVLSWSSDRICYCNSGAHNEKFCRRTQKPYRPDAINSSGQPVSGRYGKISCNGNNPGNSMCSISDFPTDH